MKNNIKKNMKSNIRGENFLKSTPKIKYNNWENINGTVTLYFKRNSFVEKIVCFLFKQPKVTDIKFDELSSKVWLMINGSNTVENISKMICKETGDNLEAAYKRVILFFRYLTRKGWISF